MSVLQTEVELERSSSLEEVQDEFHSNDQDEEETNHETVQEEQPLELTKKPAEPARSTEEETETHKDNAVTSSDADPVAEEVEIKTETAEEPADNVNNNVDGKDIETGDVNVPLESQTSVIQPVPVVPALEPIHHDIGERQHDLDNNDDDWAGAEESVAPLHYDQSTAAGVNSVVYQDDGSYIEYSYQDGTKNIGEASVQVEYIGTADVSALGDGNVEYVTLTGEQPIRDQ